MSAEMDMELTREMITTAEKIYLEMCSVGITPRKAISLTSDRMGFGVIMRNTLLSRFVGKTIEENLMSGMKVEPAVRQAFDTFEIDNEKALQTLISHHEIELNRIHRHVEKDELVGIGVPGGARDASGKPIGGIKIFGQDGASIDSAQLRKN